MDIPGPFDEVTAPGDITKSSSSLRPREKRTLWIGDLDRAEGMVDEQYVQTHMFYEFSQGITQVRICRDRISRIPSFAFVEFSTAAEAGYVLEHMNGRFVPGRLHKYKLNWANFNLTDKPEAKATYSKPPEIFKEKETADKNSQGVQFRRQSTCSRTTQVPADSVSVWIGSLDPETCREEVEELFEQHYDSVCLVKLIIDPSTGLCRGFGFVHFREADDAERALVEMNGAVCRGRRIRVNRSNTSSRPQNAHGQGQFHDPSLHNAISKVYAATLQQMTKAAGEVGYVNSKRKHGVLAHCDTARVCIRGVDLSCTDEILKRHMCVFGDVLSVKLSGNGKAVVVFAEQQAALNCYKCANNMYIGTQRVGVELNGEGLDISTFKIDPTYGMPDNQGFVSDMAAFGNMDSQLHRPAVPSMQQCGFVGVMSNGLEEAGGLYSYGIQTNSDGTEAYPMYGDYSAYYAPYAGGVHPWATTCSPLDAAGVLDAAQNLSSTESEMSAHIFDDTDPSLVPSELLPPPAFSLQNIQVISSMDHHVFLCGTHTRALARIAVHDENLCEFEEVSDELLWCKSVIDGNARKKLKLKETLREHLTPEDLEVIYQTPFDVALPVM